MQTGFLIRFLCIGHILNLWSINRGTGIEMAWFEVPASADEGSSILGCFAMSTSKHLSTFRRSVVPSSSRSSSPLRGRPTIWRNIPQDLNL